MARSRVRLNPAGAASVLRSTQAVSLTKAAAESMAASVRNAGVKVGDRNGGPRERDLPVTVKVFLTDRAHATVAIAHPAGEAVQAKHGLLTKAAAEAGLDVRT